MHAEGGGGPTTWEEGGRSIPLTHTAQLLTLRQCTGQTHTTDTQGGEEGRSNTPTSWCHCVEAGSDPRGHLGVTWGVYLCAGKPPLADIILSHPPDLTRCDSVIGLAIPAMSGHIQYRGAASGDLYIRISGINRVFLS